MATLPYGRPACFCQVDPADSIAPWRQLSSLDSEIRERGWPQMYLPSPGTILCGYFIPEELRKRVYGISSGHHLPKSRKGWICHLFYQQKNLGRILVFCNVLIWTLGCNCFSYKNYSKHHKCPLTFIKFVSLWLYLKKESKNKWKLFDNHCTQLLTLKFKGKY